MTTESLNPAITNHDQPVVSVVMGSQSDWNTMRHTHELLDQFAIPHECLIVSAHRTPDRLRAFATGAHARGVNVIIAGAGGAAHLPGMVAAFTTVPVLGVPVESASLKGVDSLHSIVQMPAGVPVGTLAIGVPGAKNAAMLAIAMLAMHSADLHQRLTQWRRAQTDAVELIPTDTPIAVM
jgi:5-(carboxyamino)imidazole ribonucleotide mutase